MVKAKAKAATSQTILTCEYKLFSKQKCVWRSLAQMLQPELPCQLNMQIIDARFVRMSFYHTWSYVIAILQEELLCSFNIHLQEVMIQAQQRKGERACERDDRKILHVLKKEFLTARVILNSNDFAGSMKIKQQSSLTTACTYIKDSLAMEVMLYVVFAPVVPFIQDHEKMLFIQKYGLVVQSNCVFIAAYLPDVEPIFLRQDLALSISTIECIQDS